MARIGLDPRPTLTTRLVAAYSRRRFRTEMQPAQALGHHPAVLRATLRHETAVARWHLLDGRLKVLAEMLHEVFAFSHAEVARVLDRSEPAVRQLAHRACEHVAARRPRFRTSPAEHLDVTRRFVAACEGASVERLLEVLAPDVVLGSDGGGVVAAARRPVTGADDVARFVAGIVRKGGAGAVIDVVQVNGSPALRVSVGGRVVACTQLVVPKSWTDAAGLSQEAWRERAGDVSRRCSSTASAGAPRSTRRRRREGRVGPS